MTDSHTGMCLFISWIDSIYLNCDTSTIKRFPGNKVVHSALLKSGTCSVDYIDVLCIILMHEIIHMLTMWLMPF
jgi:hypothetical protein